MTSALETVVAATEGRAFEVSFNPETFWPYFLTPIRAAGAIERIPVLDNLPDWAILRAAQDVPADEYRLLFLHSIRPGKPFNITIDSGLFDSVWLARTPADVAEAAKDFEEGQFHGLILVDEDVDAENPASGDGPLTELAAGGVVAILPGLGLEAEALAIREACIAKGLQPGVISTFQAFPTPAEAMGDLLDGFDAVAVLDSPGGPVSQLAADWLSRFRNDLASHWLDPGAAPEEVVDALFAAAVRGGRFEDPR
ncbi:MAG: hypothetical protein RJQ21_08795 [Rhodospirillales bacterium]